MWTWSFYKRWMIGLTHLSVIIPHVSRILISISCGRGALLLFHWSICQCSGSGIVFLWSWHLRLRERDVNAASAERICTFTQSRINVEDSFWKRMENSNKRILIIFLNTKADYCFVWSGNTFANMCKLSVTLLLFHQHLFCTTLCPTLRLQNSGNNKLKPFVILYAIRQCFSTGGPQSFFLRAATYF